MPDQRPKPTRVQVPLVVDLTADQVAVFVLRLGLNPDTITTAQVVTAVQAFVLSMVQASDTLSQGHGRATITVRGLRHA